MAESSEEIKVNVKWASKTYLISVYPEDTLGELKKRICEVTNVLPIRQKIVGLKARPAGDHTLVQELALKPSTKLMMIGSVESEILADGEDSPEVENDLSLPSNESVDIRSRPENTSKLLRRAATYKIKVLNPPREGKKLLVLDIDYTIFDHRSAAETPLQLMRPYLHEFLTRSFSNYDIVIWSATNMKWVQLKMRELGVLDHSAYKVLALMDYLAMITVHSKASGLFDCKPLGVIWNQLPQYGPHNSIMFDDLVKNFVMNPESGLVITPFKNAHLTRETDRELQYLAQYLEAIAPLEDFQTLDHSKWMQYLAQRPGGF